MRTHTKMVKFCTVGFSLVILWCCTLRANGDTSTNFDPYPGATNLLFKIISGIQNTNKVNPLRSILSVNMNAEAINFNVSITFSDSNTKEIEHEPYKAPIKKVRSDYTLTEGIGYHKFHKTKLNWNDARKACMAENAHLAVINSAEEYKLLRELIRVNVQFGTEYQVYIGVHDLFEEGDWVTVTGELLDSIGYSAWAPNKPNSYSGTNEDRVTLYKNRGMNDVNVTTFVKYLYDSKSNCNNAFYSICIDM